ncbi:MAG: ribonuclease HII [Akkermansia sp.]
MARPLVIPVSPDFSYEQCAIDRGLVHLVGVDEAGRGPLAGVVVAGAVMIHDQSKIPPGLNDSKKLNEAKRELLFHEILACPSMIGATGIASVEEIDRLNILRATHLAMARAVDSLGVAVDFCLIDGLPVRGFPYPYQSIVKGDGLSLSIAAASILAKVTRDHMMIELDEKYPEYGFAKHKGYGTKQHMEALRHYGPCPEHRRSFAPVAQMELPLS